jgi:uncharacterized membrane protein
VKIKIVQWISRQLTKMVNSIAFYPACMALVYLVLSYIMITVDFSDTGKQLKAQMHWLRLKDASTARTVVSVIAGGILSLTVFSFTMVMVVLNQAASQMSNRILDKLIGNRFQQVVLGFYIGTIVYALFLLSSIRDIDSGIYVPSLSTYLLIAFAIIDIFLFIYFLHYITQSVKYRVIINRIERQTHKALKQTCRLDTEPELIRQQKGMSFPAPNSGIFEGFSKKALVDIAKKKDCIFSFLFPPGTFVLKGAPILNVSPEAKEFSDDEKEALGLTLHINEEESIEDNFYYGFRQLTEVAIKALSPGINDPGTAVESLRALFELLSYRLKHFSDNVIRDDKGVVRIITMENSFEAVFEISLLPIWDYGKHDRFIQAEMHHLLLQLQSQQNHPAITKLLIKVKEQE